MNADDSLTAEEREIEPITDSTMPHPVGTTMGATGGALAGAAAGMAGGPVGTAIGAVVGAVVGGVAGNAAAAAISPTEEELYWSENHPGQTYADSEFDFEDYRPAYRMGYSGPDRYRGSFEASETAMRSDWENARGESRLDWERAKPAVRAAWERATDRNRPPTSSPGGA